MTVTDAATAGHSHDHDDHKPGFFVRWFCSTNHKDIGTLYIIFSIVAGLIGGWFSMMMRHELGDPGIQLAADGQEWNVWIKLEIHVSNPSSHSYSIAIFHEIELAKSHHKPSPVSGRHGQSAGY